MEFDSAAIKTAARQLSRLSATETDIIIADMADALEASIETVMSANKADLSCMDPANPKYDRLQLTPDRIRAIATDCRNVSRLPSPLGRELQHRTMPNGLDITRISVAFGVIGVIYEARPNVTMDVTSLCLKAGSAVVLKGGKDADHTNRAIAQVIHSVLHNHGLSSDTVTLLPATRQATAQLLGARDLVDLLIPRGSADLINYVRENASVPVIETGAGVVHCYVDQDADLQMAARIVQNAKCRRVSVCNALDCLLVHRTLESKLDQILSLVNDCVTIHYGDYGREWLSYDMSVKIVDSIDQAIQHINTYGSGHSEAIVTDNQDAAARFLREVDAACVYHNAPTSFTDGAQFGLGSEIGISTQKLHARGPMSLQEITTYKWIIKGAGQIRC